MRPKGKLLIIGGAEDRAGNEAPDMETKNIKFKRYEILKELLSASKKSIAVITAASRIQNEIRRSYSYAFERLHYDKPRFIQIKERSEAKDKAIVADVKKAGSVFFTGGDQTRLTALLAGTELNTVIKERYLEDREFLLAGTSAGAMALGNIMIAEGTPDEALIAKKLKLTTGLKIVNNYIIDTHFIKRGRFGRLAHAILLHPDHIGIGLGEDSALIIKNGIAECRGSGMVVIIDGQHIRSTNITSAIRGEPIYAENLKVHLLVKGNHFSFKHKRIILKP